LPKLDLVGTSAWSVCVRWCWSRTPSPQENSTWAGGRLNWTGSLTEQARRTRVTGRADGRPSTADAARAALGTIQADSHVLLRNANHSLKISRQ
jgi:hypothetical protein